MAYTGSSAGVSPPIRVIAHFTRGMTASWALIKCVPLEEVYAAAGWTSSLTFGQFYCLNVASSVASSVLQTG